MTMKTCELAQWQRLDYQGTPIYLQPETPLWVVPNASGDQVLREVQDGGTGITCEDPLWVARARQLLRHMAVIAPEPYPGRAALLPLERLEECWLHITDRCNLTCRHCLFACSPDTRTTLPLADFKQAFRQSFALGARIFFLTGGEPLMHPEFADMCRIILTHSPHNHLVLLTNGLLLTQRWSSIKELPLERLHLQISVDGQRMTHDRVRGTGSYDRMRTALAFASEQAIDTNLAMAVDQANLQQMTHPVELAATYGFPRVHYLWLLAAGKAQADAVVPADALFEGILAAYRQAQTAGVDIDNLTALAGRVFSPPGTRHDLGGGGYTSLAVGPDGRIYPTPALVGQAPACGGHLRDGLETVWRQSEMFQRIRSLSVSDDPDESDDPLRFLIGGSDMDHSYTAAGRFCGADPYRPLYRRLALWMLAEAAGGIPETAWPQVRLHMGDRLLSCDNGGKGVRLTHSNCVLSVEQTREVVGTFYSHAAVTPNTDIRNPVCYDAAAINHIPESARVRSYGCGSPVLDANVKPGETMVDVGSGAGVECFIAAKKVGPSGTVFGIDMTDEMLALAGSAVDTVATELGYANVHFKKGLLEAIPLDNESADVVISNCVVNLSADKQRTFAEMFRILKPGGRLVISDVTTDSLPPAAILNDAKLRGECISGALVQGRLIALLEAIGFQRIQILKRFFYREVQGHRFDSLTYAACRPGGGQAQSILYPGPFAALITDSGRLVLRGEKTEIHGSLREGDGSHLFFLDAQGDLVGPQGENSCACHVPPEEQTPARHTQAPAMSPARQSIGCMRCGSPLEYFVHDRTMACSFCGQALPANSCCTRGHFVCDGCHRQDADAVVRRICLTSSETDMIALINTIRGHPAVPLHGPEHHIAVPGVIVATYRNLGGDVEDADILTAMDRGQGVPGGSCGFWGGCGAALGAGIAFGVILRSSPVAPAQRQLVQTLTGSLITGLGSIEAARCCQREIWSVLKKAAALSERILPIPLRADGDTHCRQMHVNKECPGRACPWFEKRSGHPEEAS